MLNNYGTIIFAFFAGMVFGVFALAWLIMKLYKAQKKAENNE